MQLLQLILCRLYPDSRRIQSTERECPSVWISWAIQSVATAWLPKKLLRDLQFSEVGPRKFKNCKYSGWRSQERPWAYLTTNRSEDALHPPNKRSSSNKPEDAWVVERATSRFFKFITSNPSQRVGATNPTTFLFYVRTVTKKLKGGQSIRFQYPASR